MLDVRDSIHARSLPEHVLQQEILPCLFKHTSYYPTHPLQGSFKPNTNLFKVHLIPSQVRTVKTDTAAVLFFSFLRGNVGLYPCCSIEDNILHDLLEYWFLSKYSLLPFLTHSPEKLTHPIGLPLITVQMLCNKCLH